MDMELTWAMVIRIPPTCREETIQRSGQESRLKELDEVQVESEFGRPVPPGAVSYKLPILSETSS